MIPISRSLAVLGSIDPAAPERFLGATAAAEATGILLSGRSLNNFSIGGKASQEGIA
jgi:hypothetical protein